MKHPPTYIYTPPSLAPPVLERSGPPLRSVALRSELDPPLARSLLGGQISSQHLFPCFFQPEMAKCSKKRLGFPWFGMPFFSACGAKSEKMSLVGTVRRLTFYFSRRFAQARENWRKILALIRPRPPPRSCSVLGSERTPPSLGRSEPSGGDMYPPLEFKVTRLQGLSPLGRLG